jgi:hypothetical protein
MGRRDGRALLNMNRTLRAAGYLALVFYAASTGCSGRSGRPETVPVRGIVTYQGKPVAGASVAFLAPGAPAPASGTTNAAGKFQLSTFASNDGAVVGKHVVTVRELPGVPEMPITSASPSDAVDPKAIDQAMERTAQAITQAKKARSSIPGKYADRKMSDLRLDVIDGENFFEIELTD